MKKYVIQRKCSRWFNCVDINAKTLYFETVEDAKNYISSKNISGNYRIAEYLGGRKYKEIRL